MAIRILIDRFLVERGMSVEDFAMAVRITPANVAVLKKRRRRQNHPSQNKRSCRHPSRSARERDE